MENLITWEDYEKALHEAIKNEEDPWSYIEKLRLTKKEKPKKLKFLEKIKNWLKRIIKKWKK